MAHTTTTLVLVLLLLVLSSSSSASARPCKTIFFFSSTTYNTIPSSLSLNTNPTHPHILTLYLTSSNPHHRFFLIPKPPSTRLTFDQGPLELPRAESSIKDRTRDIISVVGALLFGMGCGALTAATMYLLWSFFTPNTFDFQDSDEEEFDDDLYNTKKMAQGGYVPIPTKVVHQEEVKAVAE